MPPSQLFLLGLIALASAATTSVDYIGTPPSPSAACALLKGIYPNSTLLPSDAGYEAENEVSWNAGAWLSPACIFTATSATQLSAAVLTLSGLQTLFAMRGGGHMPVETAANINSSGVLLSSTKLNSMSLSDDLGTMSVGPGNRWGDVYAHIDGITKSVTVVGGRYGPVGVPGLLLGGGMSFYSYEYGFSSSNGNVKAYECVLASGAIVVANETNKYSDLYWALRGGGNSFCLVTRFDLKTIPISGTMIGQAHYGTTAKEAWFQSILNFAVQSHGDDSKGTIIPVARLASNETLADIIYDSDLFYNGNDSRPAVLADFLGDILTPLNTTVAPFPFSVAQFAQAVTPAFKPGGQSYGLHQRFHVVSTLATIEAMRIVHDAYFAGIEKHALTNMTSFFTGLAWNSITRNFLAQSNNGIGTPMGVPSDQALFWVEESISWGSAVDTPRVEAFMADTNQIIQEELEKAGLTSDYLYLNDSDQTQDVFAGYPAENVARLKSIRAKYDPKMVYTKLMPGGFKVALAK